jgi:hypothetical protein
MMSNSLRKIRKKAEKFKTALKAIENAFADQRKAGDNFDLPGSFDLKSVVESELKNADAEKRKEKNKRKAKRRALKGK